MGQDDPTRARRGRPPNDANAPHGPDEVVEAVVAAAIAQFAQGGIAGVTVRQIAAQAGVNPGLIHRYIGSKAELVRVAVAAAGADVDRQPDGVHDPLASHAAQERVTRYERLLAHLALEDHDLTGMDLESSRFTEVAARVRRAAGLDPRAARIRALSIMALDIGWRLFGPLVAATTRLDGDGEAEVWAALARASADLGGQA